jgi:hypothetical protein
MKPRPKVSRYESSVNLYGYKRPVKYDLETMPTGTTLHKACVQGDVQVSRVEIRCEN